MEFRFSKLTMAFILGFSLFMNGCQKNEPFDVSPSIEKIRNIAKLSTIDAYFHNVQSTIKKPGSGFQHWFETERKYWLTYSGIVTYGINLSDADIIVEDTTYTIKIPSAEVQTVTVDSKSLSKDSVITSSDNFWNRNQITDEDQVKLIAQANSEMELAAWQNTMLLQSAQNRAADLIRNYVSAIGDAAGIEYTINIELDPIEIPERIQKAIEEQQASK